MLQVTLSATIRDAAAAETEYRIAVWTSDCKFAGTDASVFIELSGSGLGATQSTSRHILASSKNDFERGSEDRFIFRCETAAKSYFSRRFLH